MEKILVDYVDSLHYPENRKKKSPGPVITISRECGCSAKRIATKLAKILTGYSFQSDTKTDVEWKWVSKEIIEETAKRLALDPGKIRNVFLGEVKSSLHEVSVAFSTEPTYTPDDQAVIDTVRDVVMRIAEEGHYIIVGRAASVIAGEIPGILRIKLQAPLEWRVNRIMQISNLSHADARDYVLKVDQERELFIEHVAGQKLDNTDFDLIFNYSTMIDDHIVDTIVNILKNKGMIIHSEEDN